MAKQDDKQQTLTPSLRFPEFREPWGTMPLGTVAKSITERVGTGPCTPYTVTSGVGLVSQQDKFGRTIAGNSLKNYIRLRKDDFAYNKSATKAFPEGYITRYLDDAKAAVPNSIFTCFRVDSETIDPAYLDFLFASNLHGRWLRKFLTVGARAHGSLNVSDDDLMTLPVPVPPGKTSLAEQRKIAEFLGSLDELIAAEGRKLEALRSHKKGLMQHLFPREGETLPRLRFPEFRAHREWEATTIGTICKLKAGEFVSASNISEEPRQGLFPCYGGNGLRGYVESFTHEGTFVLIGRQGALCGNVNLFHGKFHATEHALVVTPQEGVATNFLFHAFGTLNLNRFSIGQAQPGLSVGVLNGVTLSAPVEEAEQQRIAGCLCSLDAMLAGQSQKLVSLRAHKRALMQQLFPSRDGD